MPAADLLAPEFDPVFYRATYPDVRGLDDPSLAAHWLAFGIPEGRAGSLGALRTGFLAILKEQRSLLEIGPLANPLVEGVNVRYFDVLPTEKLREKASELGLDATRCPDIHYYDEEADLSSITDRFSAVVSSHAVEHQPDFVKHLRVVGSLLHPGGRYFLAIPDQRYCFDHFLPPSTIAHVLDGHIRGAERHSAASVINMMALKTHNDPGRHWRGDHGEPEYLRFPDLLLAAADHYRASNGQYLDTHAWQFTPDSFRHIVQVLFELRLQPLMPVRVYSTVRDQLEFYAVLQLIDG